MPNIDDLETLKELPASDVLTNIFTYHPTALSESASTRFASEMLIAHTKVRELLNKSFAAFSKNGAPYMETDTVSLNPKGVDVLLLDLINTITESQSKGDSHLIVVGDSPTLNGEWSGNPNPYEDQITVILPPKKDSKLRRGFVVAMQYGGQGAKKIEQSLHSSSQSYQMKELIKLQQKLASSKSLQSESLSQSLGIRFFELPFKESK